MDAMQLDWEIPIVIEVLKELNIAVQCIPIDVTKRANHIAAAK